MARLDLQTLKKIEKEKNNIHPAVETTYTVFTKNGEKYVQFDTYGNTKHSKDVIERLKYINPGQNAWTADLTCQKGIIQSYLAMGSAAASGWIPVTVSLNRSVRKTIRLLTRKS